MLKIINLIFLICVALVFAESRVQQRRGLAVNNQPIAVNNPYLFLSVPRGRSGSVVQGFEILDGDVHKNVVTNDEDSFEYEDRMNDSSDDYDVDESDERKTFSIQEDDAEDVDDEDDIVEQNKINKFKNSINFQAIMKNVKPTHMAVSREHAGAIMVPDGIIEIEGQSVIDEKTGQEALLVPRAALDAIPDGSVVALMERSLDEPIAEERANRVYVRRRRKGSRKNVRRGGNKRRRGGNKNRRRISNRKNIRVINTGGKNRRRRVNGSIRPVRIQG